MKDVIETLIELQEIDDEIRTFVTERDAIQSRIDRLRMLLEQGKNQLEQRRERLAEVERFYREKDAEYNEGLQMADKAKTKLAASRDTKQYMAAQRELEEWRRINAQREEEILKLMEAITEYKEHIAREEESIAKLAAELDEAVEASSKRLGELEAEIGKRKGNRDAVFARLPRSVGRKYERISRRREGVAVVEVVDGTCTGCNLALPPQQFIELMRCERLMTCPSCQRFVYARLPEPAGSGAPVE